MGVAASLDFFKAWRDVRRFKKLPRRFRRLVFYSEGRAYWPHLGPLVRELVEQHDFPVTYVSSSADDPGLAYAPDRVNSFCIGFGTWRTLWFLQLDVDVLVMTMPDLDTFHIKRSKCAPVHYVYVQHAPVSTHMMYRERAFDGFDTVFLSGPHHEAEIRLREKLLALRPKQLVAHGYCRMDELLKEHACGQADTAGGRGAAPLKVAIAPSWGDNGIFDSCGPELIRCLLANGFQVTFRPHPQSFQIRRDAIAAYRREFGGHASFRFDSDTASSDFLWQADVMVTDWSGVAYDYAFVRKRPVLFIDVPRKVKNPNYEQLPITPLEVAVREEIGDVLKPDSIRDAPAVIRTLIERRAEYAKRCDGALHSWLYNVGTSAPVGAEALIGIADSRRPAEP